MLRLKVPITEAVGCLDKAIEDGAGVLNLLVNSYARSFWERRDEAGDLLDGSALPPEDCLLNFGDHFEECILRYYAWVDDAKNILKEIYEDFSPYYAFVMRGATVEEVTEKAHQPHTLESQLRAKLEYLISRYEEVRRLFKIPLFYDKNKIGIWFYDYWCEIQEGTLQESLCAYMFGYEFGRKINYVQIYDDIIDSDFNKGVIGSNIKKNNIANISSEINKKTREAFGFAVFKEAKTTLSLKVPLSIVGQRQMV